MSVILTDDEIEGAHHEGLPGPPIVRAVFEMDRRVCKAQVRKVLEDIMAQESFQFLKGIPPGEDWTAFKTSYLERLWQEVMEWGMIAR